MGPSSPDNKTLAYEKDSILPFNYRHVAFFMQQARDNRM